MCFQGINIFGLPKLNKNNSISIILKSSVFMYLLSTLKVVINTCRLIIISLQCRRPGLIPGSRRSPGEGNSNSSILAWRIPWTEEPGRLQPMGSQSVRHDWATNTLTLLISYIYVKFSPNTFPSEEWSAFLGSAANVILTGSGWVCLTVINFFLPCISKVYTTSFLFVVSKLKGFRT